MRFLSVCSGIEAASCAWHPLGWKAVAFAEIEPFPSAVLAARWPNVPNLGDMTKFQQWPDFYEKETERSAIDLLVGGTPCQSFSIAGLRKGMADPRGNLALTFLALTFLAIAARYRPRWVVWENVPGALSDKGNAFGCFLAGLAELGYGWAYRILDAQHAGVPQRRRRVFVVGHLGDWRRAAAVLFERHSLQGHSAPSREAGQRVAPTVEARANGAGGGWGTDFMTGGGPTLNAHFGDKQGLEDQHVNGGCGLFVSVTPDIAPTLGASPAATGQSPNVGNGQGQIVAFCRTPLVPVVTPIDMRQASNRRDGSTGGAPGTGIGDPGEPSPTIVSSHAPEVCISPTEANEVWSQTCNCGQRYIGRLDEPCPGCQSFQGGITHGAPIAFDTTQITSKANRCNPQAGDPCHPLAAGAHAPAVAFNWQAGGTQTTLGFDPSRETTGALEKSQTPAVAFQTRIARNGRGQPSEVCPALNGSDAGATSDMRPCVATETAVRRLTATECARLQGFPDDYLELLYANAEEAHAAQVLHILWRKAGEKATQEQGWGTGIIASLLTPEVLLSGVHGGWLSWAMAHRSACASREVSGAHGYTENLLLCLRRNEELGRSPFRRESFEQCAVELARPVQALPLERAQARSYLRSSELWKEAQAAWPLRYAFSEKKAGRPDNLNPDGPRYKALGNSMAVPCMRWIGERIAMVDAR